MDTNKLRQKILDMAIRGKLVPQDPNDEPASVLLERIRNEKQRMVQDGKLKKRDIKNDTIIFRGDDNLHYEKFQDGSVKCIEDEIPFEVPEGWAWARMSSLTQDLPYGTLDCQHFFRQIFLGYFSDIVQAFDTLRKNVCGDDYTSLHNPIVLSSVLPAYGMFHSIQILFL